MSRGVRRRRFYSGRVLASSTGPLSAMSAISDSATTAREGLLFIAIASVVLGLVGTALGLIGTATRTDASSAPVPAALSSEHDVNAQDRIEPKKRICHSFIDMKKGVDLNSQRVASPDPTRRSTDG